MLWWTMLHASIPPMSVSFGRQLCCILFSFGLITIVVSWGHGIIGITGTNGKTTTKELIAHVLMEKYRVLYTQGNLNNQIGVPLTLLRLTPDDEIAVVEMGANHPVILGSWSTLWNLIMVLLRM